MAREKMGTVITPVEDNRTYTKNMFTSPLGDKYARAFHEVYHASIQDRDQKMKKLYEDSKEDTSLNDKQKKIIASCYVGYLQAICKNSLSIPIIDFVAKHKPVLSKAIRTQRKKKNKIVPTNHLKRTVNDLYDVVNRTGFYFEVATLPTLIKVFENQFVVKSDTQKALEDNDLTFETLVLAALSKFGRGCSPISYANMWYISIFMQNISLLTYINPKVYQEMPELRIQILNLVKSIRYILALEMQRAGIIKEEPKQEESTDTAVTTINKNVLINNCNKYYDYLLEAVKPEEYDESTDTDLEYEEKWDHYERERNQIEHERQVDLESIENNTVDPNVAWYPDKYIEE